MKEPQAFPTAADHSPLSQSRAGDIRQLGRTGGWGICGDGAVPHPASSMCPQSVSPPLLVAGLYCRYLKPDVDKKSKHKTAVKKKTLNPEFNEVRGMKPRESAPLPPPQGREPWRDWTPFP